MGKAISRSAIGMAFAAMTAATFVAAPLAAKTLVYCSEGAPEGFDPALYTSNTTWDASAETVYDRLTAFELGSTVVIPALAESWTISPDNLVYTLSLRKGVAFQSTEGFVPTRDFNADDVLFSFERQLDAQNPWFSYLPGADWSSFTSMDMPRIIKSIEKVDDYTVRFVLNEPDGSLLAKLALNFGAIMSKEYADQLAKEGRMADLNVIPVGTGPFRFVDYQQDAVIRYQANDAYWGGRPRIDDLIFAITVDPTARIQRLRAGECQVAAYPAPADVPALKADANLQVEEQAGLNISYLAFNTLVAPFDKIEVRKALSMAIDKKAIIDAVYMGMGASNPSSLPPTMWGYNDTLTEYPYDPAKATEMLKAAGVEGLKMKIWAMPVSRPYMPNARRVAEMMQADLAKIGVEVEIVSYEWAEYLKRSTAKDRDGAVILGATSDNGDPDNLLSYFFSCSDSQGSRTNWCNPKADDLIRKARSLSDQGERSVLYKEVQQIVHDEAPELPLATATVILPMAKSVRNYVMDPLGAHRFGKVDIEE